MEHSDPDPGAWSRRLRHELALVLLLTVAATPACEGPPEPADVGTAVVRDSAGVLLAELSTHLSDLSAPDLRLRQRYSIGAADSDLDLFRVSGARFLPDGRLVIGNAGVLELVLVDQVGRVVTRFGNEGEGPAEFQSVSSVHVTASGTIVVFDDMQGRVSEFDTTGRFLETRRRIEPHPARDLLPLVASMSGPLVGVYGDNRILGQGPIVHDTTPLLRYPTGATRPDTLSLWARKMWSLRDIGFGGLRVEVAFGPSLLAFGQSDYLVLADSHTARVSVLDQDGNPTMDVRWNESAQPVTEADVETYRGEMADRLADDVPDIVRTGYLEAPHHETRPILNGVALDHDRRVWIAPTALRADDEQGWLVIDRLGEVRGRIWLAAGSHILDVRDGWVAALSQDEYDTEIISVFSIAEFAAPDG